MKWPWVSRDRFDELRQHHYAAVAALDADYSALVDTLNANEEQWARRYDALIEKYHALKLSGAEPVPPPVAAGAIAPPAPDELRELIGEVCGTDYAKRKIMLRQLALDRATEIEDDVIRAAILQGVSADGVPT